MAKSTIENRPQSIAAALRLLVDVLVRERAMFVSAVVGLALGVVGLVVATVHGPIIEPEGVLRKAISFDFALGIYVLTVSLFLPLSGFSPKGLRRWCRWHVGLTYLAYGFENIQIARGLDPRFTTHGTPADQMLGGLFFLQAVGLVVLFVILVRGIFKVRHEDSSLLLATRYAFATTMLAFGAGFWMSFGQGPTTGAANILPLHAVGFHGLQAVPLVALLLGWAGLSSVASRPWIHAAGLTWLSACITIAIQTMLGRPLLEPSTMPLLTIFLLAGWGVVCSRSIVLWLNAKPAVLTRR